jgi:RNA polymerase sigma-70 factor (ECF subfamily)
MGVGEHGFDSDYFTYDLIKLQEQLYYYALQLTEDREDALDLVQETSFKALKNRNRLHNNDHIRAWLYTILKNTYINYLRSSHFRQLIHDTDELYNHSVKSDEGTDALPDEQLINKELHEIIRRLPGAYEKPILLFLAGFSYKEIAQKMNIPIGTVKSRIHLGKKQIRKVYSA